MEITGIIHRKQRVIIYVSFFLPEVQYLFRVKNRSSAIIRIISINNIYWGTRVPVHWYRYLQGKTISSEYRPAYLVLAKWSSYPTAQCDMFKCIEGHFTFMKLNKVLDQKSGSQIWYVVDIFKKTMLLRLCCLSTICESTKPGFLHLYTTLCSTA